mmetsp:Transcript_20233/g.44179  ORF Transcript_20233/g.44179 Transcript_20233/m.44179 type:complete len:154 (-) Transcript_20233:424-885(-)
MPKVLYAFLPALLSALLYLVINDAPSPSAKATSEVIRPSGTSSAGTAPPLVFVPGNIHSGFVFRGIAAALARHGYRIHLLTLPKSRFRPLAAYLDGIERYVLDLDAAPVLLGHSQGGMLVQHFLLNRNLHLRTGREEGPGRSLPRVGAGEFNR